MIILYADDLARGVTPLEKAGVPYRRLPTPFPAALSTSADPDCYELAVLVPRLTGVTPPRYRRLIVDGAGSAG